MANVASAALIKFALLESVPFFRFVFMNLKGRGKKLILFSISLRSVFMLDGTKCEISITFEIRVVANACSCSLWEVKAGNQKFKVIFDSIADLRPVWAGYMSPASKTTPKSIFEKKKKEIKSKTAFFLFFILFFCPLSA